MSETAQSGFSDKTAGALAYITLIPAIVFLLLPPYNTSPFVRFHAWQSIFFSSAFVVVTYAMTFALAFSVIFGAAVFSAVTWVVWLAWILVWVLCAVNAINGKFFKLPLIGALAERMANK